MMLKEGTVMTHKIEGKAEKDAIMTQTVGPRDDSMAHSQGTIGHSYDKICFDLVWHDDDIVDHKDGTIKHSEGTTGDRFVTIEHNYGTAMT